MDLPLPEPGREPCVGGLQPPGCSVRNGEALVENLIAENQAYRAMLLGVATSPPEPDIKQCIQNLELKVSALGGGHGAGGPIIIAGPAAADPGIVSSLQSQLTAAGSERKKCEEKYEEAKKKAKEYEQKYEEAKEKAKEYEQKYDEAKEKAKEYEERSVSPTAVEEVLEKEVYGPVLGTVAPPLPGAETVQKERYDALKRRCDSLETEMEQLRESKAADCSQYEREAQVLREENQSTLEKLAEVEGCLKELENCKTEAERLGVAATAAIESAETEEIKRLADVLKGKKEEELTARLEALRKQPTKLEALTMTKEMLEAWIEELRKVPDVDRELLDGSENQLDDVINLIRAVSKDERAWERENPGRDLPAALTDERPAETALKYFRDAMKGDDGAYRLLCQKRAAVEAPVPADLKAAVGSGLDDMCRRAATGKAEVPDFGDIMLEVTRRVGSEELEKEEVGNTMVRVLEQTVKMMEAWKSQLGAIGAPESLRRSTQNSLDDVKGRLADAKKEEDEEPLTNARAVGIMLNSIMLSVERSDDPSGSFRILCEQRSAIQSDVPRIFKKNVEPILLERCEEYTGSPLT